jgi:hypothetical protein
MILNANLKERTITADMLYRNGPPPSAGAKNPRRYDSCYYEIENAVTQEELKKIKVGDGPRIYI